MIDVAVAPAEPREMLCTEPIRYGLLRQVIGARDALLREGVRADVSRCALCGGYHLRRRS